MKRNTPIRLLALVLALAMLLCGCAALFCREPVVLRGGNCVAKSYEDFWRDYAMLGGKTEELMES